MADVAEAFPVGDFIREEMDARNWSIADMARAMAGDYEVNRLTLELIFANSPEVALGDETDALLCDAFGVSRGFFANLDKTYRDHTARKIVPEAAP